MLLRGKDPEGFTLHSWLEAEAATRTAMIGGANGVLFTTVA